MRTAAVRRRVASLCVRARGAGEDQPHRSAADLQHVSGHYIPLSELQAYTKKAIAEKLIDQQVQRHRDRQGARRHRHGASRQAGQARAGLGRRARPGQRGLPHHRRHGDARARAGHRQPAAASGDAADRARVQRSRQQRIRDSQRRRLQPQAGRRRRHSGGHRPLVHEDRRSHRLPDGSDRSRQGHAAQGRGRVEGVPVEACAR